MIECGFSHFHVRPFEPRSPVFPTFCSTFARLSHVCPFFPRFVPRSTVCATFALFSHVLFHVRPFEPILFHVRLFSSAFYKTHQNASKQSENITKHYQLQQSTIINIFLHNPPNFI